jgi:pheromone a factor receptor
LFEDFGPFYDTVLTAAAFPLFYAWPVAIGCVSLVYCSEYLGSSSLFDYVTHQYTVLTIYTFYKRHNQFKQVMSSNRNLNSGRYFRLMALSTIEILGTIPLATYYIVYNARNDLLPWGSWTNIHYDYGRVVQYANFVWKNDPNFLFGMEIYRWSLVACAFIFFAFFGFADEARQHYRLVYTTLASRIGISTTTSGTLHGSSHA